MGRDFNTDFYNGGCFNTDFHNEGGGLTRISTMRGILTRIATMGRDFNTDYHNWGVIVFFAQCCVNLCSNDSCWWWNFGEMGENSYFCTSKMKK